METASDVLTLLFKINDQIDMEIVVKKGVSGIAVKVYPKN